MKIKCDNQRAIFLEKNESSVRTKHVDVRYHFIRELIEEGIITLEYVRTSNNIADVLTKNLPTEPFKKFTKGFFYKES
jgi:hypothetical protein